MPNRQPTIPDVRVITPEDAQRLCRLCLCDQQLCEAPEQQQNDDAAERNGWLAVDNELDQLFAQLSGGQPLANDDLLTSFWCPDCTRRLRAATEVVQRCRWSKTFWTEYLRTWAPADSTDESEFQPPLAPHAHAADFADDYTSSDDQWSIDAVQSSNTSPTRARSNLSRRSRRSFRFTPSPAPTEATTDVTSQQSPSPSPDTLSLPPPPPPPQPPPSLRSARPSTTTARPCPICGVRYHQIRRHILAAHSVLECDMCGRKFTHKVTLRRHFRDDHGFQRYTCDGCGRTNLTHSLWERHQEMHRPLHERPLACDQCSQQFPTMHNLRQHIARVHIHTQVACAECGKRFKNAVGLRDHMVRHQPKSVVCTVAGCPRMFWMSKEMKEHCRTVHEKDRKYGCDVCGKHFLVNAQLKKHHSLKRCLGPPGSGAKRLRRRRRPKPVPVETTAPVVEAGQ